jgi:acetyl esterase/lipase
MKTIARILSFLALALGILPYVRHTSRATIALLGPKYLATALAAHVVPAGALGALLGLVSRSTLAIISGALGAGLAGNYVRRVAVRHDGFARAFGTDWHTRIPPEVRQVMLQRRWSWRIPRVAEPRWTRDVGFATIPGSDRTLLADIWQPPVGVTPSGTAIVYLHGGAWYLMDKDVLTRPFFRRLAAQGHVIMDVAYRLCPETDLAGMVGDGQRAVAWIKANADRYGVHPDRVVLMGASSGGHAALLAAYAAGHPQLTPTDLRSVDTSVRAVVSYYGVADLRAYGEHTTARLADRPEAGSVERSEPGELEQALNRLMLGRTLTAEQSPPTPPHRRMMQDLVGGLPEEVPEMYDLASPIQHVNPASPPTLLFQGEHDSIVPVESARRLAEALRAAGVPVVCVEFPGTEHAFDLLYPPLVGPAAQAAFYDLERFLRVIAHREPHATSRSQQV